MAPARLESTHHGDPAIRWAGVGVPIVRPAEYGPRWCGHFVRVQSPADLDDELRGWLQESHDTVGM